VGHRQDHVALRTVLDPSHFGADPLPAAGPFPDLRRLNHRHQQLLAADGFHLFAKDLLDFFLDPVTQRKVAENSRRQRPDKTRAKQEPEAGGIRFRRVFTKRGAKVPRIPHGYSLSPRSAPPDRGSERRRG
jgi:hypothetical protein